MARTNENIPTYEGKVVDGKLVLGQAKVIHPFTCKFFILDASHYDDAGNCKCSDPTEAGAHDRGVGIQREGLPHVLAEWPARGQAG